MAAGQANDEPEILDAVPGEPSSEPRLHQSNRDDPRPVVGNDTALVPRQPAEMGIIRPVASADEVLAAWRQFQDIKRSLLTLEDYQDIQGRPRIKKSGWRKIAAAFGISDAILREECREVDTPTGRQFVWEITVRAIAPNGRYADAVGSCASTERRFAHLDHDVRATAHCVPLEAEILTRRGFRRYCDVQVGEDVLAYAIEDDMCHWTPLLGVTLYDSLPMVQLETHSFRVRCTPDHTWAVGIERGRARTVERHLYPANKLPKRGSLILAAPEEGGLGGVSLTDAAILGWLCTDRHVGRHRVTSKVQGRVYHNGPYRKVVIDQSKPEFVEEIRALVGAMSIESVEHRATRTFPQAHTSPLRTSHRFILRQREGNGLFERAGIDSLADLPLLVSRLTGPSRRAMFQAILHAEGSRRGGAWVFSQTKPAVMEVFQMLATLEGHALGRSQIAHPGVGNGPCRRYTLRVHRHAYLPALRVTPLAPEAAWCPTTAYGTWVMRLDGQVTITGNTRAKNRAIADLVGGGEVSAEEMLDGDAWEAVRTPAPASPSTAPVTPGAGPIAGPGSAAAPRIVRSPQHAAALGDERATDAQLRAIRAHLRRTGIDEARACARASVPSLDALTRRGAAELLAALSRQPNAA
ncbi:MAG TPA: hypothetical protein VII06_33810 [Chloroflexota bacterium]|jgi:hypothetical protein